MVRLGRGLGLLCLWVLGACGASVAAAATRPAVEVLRHNLTPLIERAARDPSRFAVDLPHGVSSATAGRWSVDGDVATWRYAARIPGATSVSFHARRLVLPASATLTMTAGGVRYPVRQASVGRAEYWSRVGRGDTLELELTVARRDLSKVLLEIRSIQAGYRALEPGQADHPAYRRAIARIARITHATSGSGSSCVEDFSCDASAANAAEGHASVAVIVANQWSCTGTLLNDVAQDGVPYLLTARHCENGNASGGDPAAAASVTIYWDATAVCGTAPLSVFSLSVPVQAGATTLVEQQDVWLLQLDQPPVAADAYYAGWDVSGTAPVGGYSIHDANALSQQYVAWSGTASSRLVPAGPTLGLGYAASFWEVVNARGSVDHGASGSALFTASGSVAGVLSRAIPTQCPASPPPAPSDATAVALFEQLGAVWNSTLDATSSTGVRTIASYLDPNSSGITTMPGVAGLPPTAVLTASTATAQVGQLVSLSYLPGGTSCVASGGTPGDGWNGATLSPSSATVSVTESAVGIRTYVLTCSAGTRSATATATVTWAAAPPSVSLVDLPPGGNYAATLYAGVPTTLQWNSGLSPCVASGGASGDGWTGTLAASGTLAVTEAAAGLYTYAITCGSGASAVQATLALVFNSPFAALVFATPPPPVLRIGQPITLQWNGVGTCTAGGGEAGDGWAGVKSDSGYQVLTATTGGAHVYTLTCGSGSASASTQLTQAYTTAAASATLSASAPTALINLSTATAGEVLSWNANVEPCGLAYAGPDSGTLLTGWNANASLDASADIAGLYTYTLTCGSGADQASATTTVTWTQPTPVVTLTPPGTELVLGSQSFSWSTNVLPCVGSGGSAGDGWNGTLPTDPSGHGTTTVTENVPGSYTYTITCGVGTVGTAQATVVDNTPAGSLLTFSTGTGTAYGAQTLPLSWNSQAGTCTGYGGTAGDGYTGVALPATGTLALAEPPGSYTLGLVCGTGAQAVEATAAVTYTAVTSVTVQQTQSPTQAIVGQTTTLGWSAPTAVGCTASGGNPGDGWSGAQPATGQVTVSEKTAGYTDYALTCVNGAVGGSTDWAVNWTPAPTVTLAATSLTQVVGVPFTVTWTSTSVSGCTASSVPAGLWSGATATQGSAQITVTSGTTAHLELSCTGVPLGIARGDIDITIVPPTTVSLNTSASSATVGQSFALSWTSARATSCTASGGSGGDGWAGSQPTSSTGTSLTETSPGTYGFVLACTGPGGTATASVSVDVSPAPPPKSGGGGGATDIATLLVLAVLAALRRPRAWDRPTR